VILLLAAAIGPLLGGCDPPDRPPALTAGLPRAAVAYLAPNRVATFQLEDGVVYRSIRSGEHGWSLHLLEVDVSRCDLGFRVVRAEDAEGRIHVSEAARRSEPGAIAAVNGDFFTPEFLPLGPEVSEGRLRGRTSRPVFAWRPGHVPWVGPVEWSDGSVTIGSWTLFADAPGSDMQVVAGFPPLLRNGLPVGDLEQAERPEFAARPHPRTAVGLDRRASRVWLVVVDGRDRTSDGMTLPELAGLFRSLGAGDAINLDGGSSSAMVIRGEPVSRSPFPAGDRPVVNALVVRRDPQYCS
jgi:hypothetical protein